jgi:hypothetical protein
MLQLPGFLYPYPYRMQVKATRIPVFLQNWLFDRYALATLSPGTMLAPMLMQFFPIRFAPLAAMLLLPFLKFLSLN